MKAKKFLKECFSNTHIRDIIEIENIKNERDRAILDFIRFESLIRDRIKEREEIIKPLVNKPYPDLDAHCKIILLEEYAIIQELKRLLGEEE